MVALNLRQIETFRAIMQTGSVSRAAVLLNVSQPAVSRLIATTERRMRLTLFERVKGRLQPTPEARLLFNEVAAVYAGIERIHSLVEDLVENRLGHLRIGCSPSLGLGLLPEAIARAQQQAPEARTSLYTMLPSVLQRSLLDHDVELGVMFLPAAHPNLQSRVLFGNRLVVAVPANHPLAARERIAVQDLRGQRFIGYGPDVPIGQLIRRLLEQVEVSMPTQIEVQQVHVALSMVQAGCGVAIVDEMTVRGPTWSGVVTRPMLQETSVPIHLLHDANVPLSRLAHNFIRALEALQVEEVERSARNP
jgi:DNA-binding transcriptional LysR family regulator